MQKKTYTTEFGNKTLTAEFTDIALRANGSVIVRYGNTAVLATAVMGKETKQLDYFPLTVDYEERFYAAGQILGSRFLRREGRPSDEAVLSGRAIDRTIRPLFDHRLRVDVQVVITILSLGEDDPDILAIIAASLALGVSDIPWNGPVGAVRIGTNESGTIINPSYSERESGLALDMLVCGTNGLINMLEIDSAEIAESDAVEGFGHALEAIAGLESFQKDIITEIGTAKRAFEFDESSETLESLFEEHIAPKLDATVFTGMSGDNEINALGAEWFALVEERAPDEIALAKRLFEDRVEASFDAGVGAGKRPDGRASDEIRALYAQAGDLAPMVHGTGLFYRGETHVLSALTLGGPEDTLIIDGMEEQTKKRYMHHYNFPPFSTGETGRIGGANRRMIGHGALAEKALLPVLPPKDAFPYTIRIVSEVMSSNGSSSMASVCGSTLALMDAGVPITRPVAGIAMGIVMRDDGSHITLTDIQGPEDHYGDMDLKVAGTRNGITAVQMDVKVNGIPVSVLAEALDRAKTARLSIIDTIEQAIPEPRAELPKTAPRVVVIKIDSDKIGLVIGSGGKTVNQIRDLTGAEISIEDDGTVFVMTKDGSAEKAVNLIEAITHEYAAGERLEGIVTRITDFGAFVRLGDELPISGMKDTEGLVHVSEIAPFRIDSVREVLAVGETVPVVIREIDDIGRINLSIKQADPEWATKKGLKPDEETRP